jgi:hypothetical protein
MKRAILVSLAAAALVACFGFTAYAGEPPCNDTVGAQVMENTILVRHDQAEWNCCAEIVFELSVAQDTFNLYEFETFGEWGPCVCICCFDLTTTVRDVAPGDYLVRVLDGLSGEIFGEVWVTVEPELSGMASLGGTEQSECGGWITAVKEPTSTTWSRLKVLYR